MKSFNTVYNNSKKYVLNERNKVLTEERKKVVNILKEEYMISGDILSLPKTKQNNLAKKVLEYWQPKKGLTKAGKKLIEGHIINLTPLSDNNDIKKYIQNETKKNIGQVIEMFKTDNVKLLIESFKADIEPKVQKILLSESIRDIVWNIIKDKIKMTK